jgi:nitrogen fixation protein NifB
MLVNLHLGEAEEFLIFGADGQLVETRPAPPPGGGTSRWIELADTLKDCRAVLVNGAGDSPRRTLAAEGLAVHLAEGLIADAVEAIYLDRLVPPPRRVYRCGEVCAGQGNGCG